jgi:hypothetical protein
MDSTTKDYFAHAFTAEELADLDKRLAPQRAAIAAKEEQELKDAMIAAAEEEAHQYRAAHADYNDNDLLEEDMEDALPEVSGRAYG